MRDEALANVGHDFFVGQFRAVDGTERNAFMRSAPHDGDRAILALKLDEVGSNGQAGQVQFRL